MFFIFAYYTHRCTEANIQGLPRKAVGDSGVDSCSSNEEVHEVAREWPAQGQALQQNSITTRSVYRDNTI